MENQQELNQLTEHINDIEFKVTKLPIDQEVNIQLNQEHEIIKNLLLEIEGEFDSEIDVEFINKKQSLIDVRINIKRKMIQPYKDVVFVKVELQYDITFPCVKCLSPAPQINESNFQICFILAHLESDPEFKDQPTIFIENEEYELAFQKKGKISLIDFIKENIYSHLDPFPLHSAECLGLCLNCGINKNFETCNHS
jgi:uncharacterized metal-binding protein YceD (DUF177 family)